MYSAIPSELHCNDVNPALWQVFWNCYKSHFNVSPKCFWSEAEVVQWLDTEYPKYNEQAHLDERAYEAEYYAQFG